jgi:hypothetical protein
MDTILIYYHEYNHTQPAGWERVPEYRVSSAVDGWLTEHPSGTVQCLTEESFAKTAYGKRELAKE